MAESKKNSLAEYCPYACCHGWKRNCSRAAYIRDGGNEAATNEIFKICPLLTGERPLSREDYEKKHPRRKPQSGK